MSLVLGNKDIEAVGYVLVRAASLVDGGSVEILTDDSSIEANG